MVTVLQSPVPEAESLTADPSSFGPLLQSVLAARGETHAILGGDGLEDTVRGLVEAAHFMGHMFLHGASPEGHALAGAMAFCSPDLRLWTPGQANAILLIDGVLAGTTGLAATAGNVRAIGAMEVDALVIGILGADDALAPPGVDRLATIHRSI